MAGNNPQHIRTTARATDREPQHPDPPMPPILDRVSAKLQLAGGACLHLLARPNTAVPLLLTCLCLAIAYKIRGRDRTPRLRRGANAAQESARPVLQRSMSVAVLHGGHVALQRIIDSQEARLNKEILEKAEEEFESLLRPGDGRMHFGKLQSVAGKLEMSGKEDEAVVLLKNAMLKAKPHDAHELGMLLVEMLIYKGDYDEALSQKCLYDDEISDARAPLYKAVIYSLQKEDTKAAENYKIFQKVQSRLHWPDAHKEETPLGEVVHDFGRFQTIVKHLKTEIDNVRERKRLQRV